MKKLILFFAFFLLATSLAQAQANLAGIVTDANEQPLAGVTILVKGTNTGTTTGTDGRFTLQAPGEVPLTVSASFVGYERKDVAVVGSNFRNIVVRLNKEPILTDEFVTAASRIPEEIQRASVSVEKLSTRQFQQSPAYSPFDALQNVKGVDVLTQSITFKSINLRGFGANNNNRFLQLTDGMDNRSPGLGFGFGNVAGISDLDVADIELIPGASSALYGPDALQGLMLTSSKNPFTYRGLSVQLKGGVNNVAKAGMSPKPFGDVAIRYARQFGTRFALKVNFQRFMGTDFIADDYNDRSTRARANFFATDPARGGQATSIGYQRNNNPNTNFQYDGVNVYGDDINSGGAFTFPANYANLPLQNRLVTRTGYTELDVVGNDGKVFNNRANVSLHYKLPGDMEASLGWYYGNGNFIRTASYREYFPNYQRHQFKAELKGKHFFLRAYTTQQQAEAWSIGQTATAINNSWKSIGQWATEFGLAFIENKVSVGESRLTADRNRYLPGTSRFNAVRDAFANTYNTDTLAGFQGARGTRFRDNSTLWHYEGMYNLTDIVQVAEVIVGGSVRHYGLNTGGTAITLKSDGSEYTINEYGAYVQASKELRISSTVTVKPTLALRYDKNQYLSGGFTPRASAVASLGTHHFRASWQTAFRNPAPGQLFLVPAAGRSGEVGGLAIASAAADLTRRPAYLESDVRDFATKLITEAQLRSRAFQPTTFTTEKIQTWEVGYKSQIQNRLFIDAFYFHSKYTHFIAAQTYYQFNSGQVSDFATNAFRTLQINANSQNELFVDGVCVGLDYSIGHGFILSGNYVHQVGSITLRDAQGNVVNDNAGQPIIKRKMSNPEVVQKGRNFFNTPENRYNLSLANSRITDRLGATLSYRWTGTMWYEQGITAGDVWLPSWSTVDAQVSYKLPQFKSVVKVGGTNLLNNYYVQGYGLARIGGMYYVSVTFDELM
ncbi:carboxypeptidase-like regulatory domain-containing protein [Spirosoma sp. BT702]|uniref:Carboxypeptidase-like regulatory domain-containing protein n=1 Tax=Spirosoma profusum TaxID=2771354 RepID=A0A926XXF5_9BACT|nr:TonB-dependent receptor [Spirosoma profusum]MBD2702444.1 carboxypeptidase-like regulatory domain-containing protein [Spirosoma profusum]